MIQDRNFVRTHGEKALWFQGAWCSCTTNTDQFPIPTQLPDPSFADVNCLVCGGTGWMFPSPGQLITGIVSAVTQDKDLADVALDVHGELIFSQDPGGPRISDLDIIILYSWTYGIPYMGQLVFRGTGSTDSLYYNAMEVVGCWQTNPSTGTITSFVPGTDFSFSGRTVTWLTGGNAPAAQSAYSIKYTPRYEWSCFIPPMPRYERATDLGQRIILRKRHIVLQNAPNLIES